VVERKITQGEIERRPCVKSRDPASIEAPGKRFEKSLGRSEGKERRADSPLAAGKEAITKIQATKENIEKAKTDAGPRRAHRRPGPGGGVEYGTLLNLQKELEGKNQKLEDLPSGRGHAQGRVTPRTWRKWSPSGPGVPVTRMLEGEKQKLLHMEERIAKRVVGQEEAVRAVSNARCRRARSGLQDPNRPWAPSSSLAHTAWASRTGPGPWPNSCSTRKAP